MITDVVSDLVIMPIDHTVTEVEGRLERFISVKEALNSTTAYNAFLEGNIRYLLTKQAHKLIEALNEKARQGKCFTKWCKRKFTRVPH